VDLGLVAMILIRFPSLDSERKALGRLTGRFSFKSWATGEMLAPETALPYLAVKASLLPSRDRRPMSSVLRRHEILLPPRSNGDGQGVPFFTDRPLPACGARRYDYLSRRSACAVSVVGILLQSFFQTI